MEEENYESPPLSYKSDNEIAEDKQQSDNEKAEDKDQSNKERTEDKPQSDNMKTEAKVVITKTKEEFPPASKQVTETGIGNKKIKITVETDIRIKNYLSHHAPISLIRKRFKEKRLIDPLNVEDILNYVIT